MKKLLKALCVTALLCLVAAYPGCKSESGSDADAGEDGSKPDAGESDGSGSDSDSDTDSDSDSDTDTDSDGDGDTDAGINCFRYVDVDSAADSPDGLSWDTAFTRIQDGIDSAHAGYLDGGTNACEVWVAEGIYYIFETDKNDSVRLLPNVHVFGGFTGTEDSRESRDWEENKTILSGFEPGTPLDAGLFVEAEQVDHVVTGSDYALIDGFTIMGGHAYESGGGMYNYNSSPEVRNCTFTRNDAFVLGGSVYNYESFARFINCYFVDNQVLYQGNGMYNEGGSPTVTDCIFSQNEGREGAGIYNLNSSPIINNCIFSGNQVTNKGAGIYNAGGAPQISNCVFVDNEITAQGTDIGRGGGGICNEYSLPYIDKCIFSNNSFEAIGNHLSDSWIVDSIFSGYGIGVSECEPTIENNIMIAINGIIGNWNGLPVIRNSILIDSHPNNENDSIYLSFYSKVDIHNSILWEFSFDTVHIENGSDLNIYYSLVSNDFPSGEGNITGDPLFEGNPLMTGVWSSVSYNEDRFQTRMKDDASSWDTDELKNMFVQVDEDNEPRWFYIVENTEDTLRVWGDVTDYAESGDTYSIFDLHLSENSPCIDTASDDDAPDTDIEGNSRVDVPGKGDNGTAADMGAYEYQP